MPFHAHMLMVFGLSPSPNQELLTHLSGVELSADVAHLRSSDHRN